MAVSLPAALDILHLPSEPASQPIIKPIPGPRLNRRSETDEVKSQVGRPLADLLRKFKHNEFDGGEWADTRGITVPARRLLRQRLNPAQVHVRSQEQLIALRSAEFAVGGRLAGADAA